MSEVVGTGVDIGTGGAADQAAQISIRGGNPTPEEVAAVVTAVLAASGGGSSVEPTPVPSSGWSAYWRSVRRPVQPGPGAWRASARS